MFKYRNVRHKISTIRCSVLENYTVLYTLQPYLWCRSSWPWPAAHNGDAITVHGSTSLRLSQHTKGATLKKFTQEIQVEVQNKGRSLIAPLGAGRVVVHEKEHVHMTTKPTSSAESAPL